MVAIILNGISRRKKQFYNSILPPLKASFSIDVFETTYAGHAQLLAAEVSRQGYTTIIAAGGDGTLHQVLNGIMTAGTAPSTTLGLIPLGSGNDFANASGLTRDARQLISLLQNNNPTAIDIGIVQGVNGQGAGHQEYFINACSIALGPATVKEMQDSYKWAGPLLRYLLSILKTFFTYKPQPVVFQSQSSAWHGKVRLLAIANGTSFGNKIYIAPKASQSDGVFNSFIVGELPLPKFLWYLQKVKAKEIIIDHQIQYGEGASFQLSSPEPMAVEADGELIGFLPASISVYPKKIMFLKPAWDNKPNIL